MKPIVIKINKRIEHSLTRHNYLRENDQNVSPMSVFIHIYHDILVIEHTNKTVNRVMLFFGYFRQYVVRAQQIEVRLVRWRKLDDVIFQRKKRLFITTHQLLQICAS